MNTVISKNNKLITKTAAFEKESHLSYFNIAVSVDCVIFGYDNDDLKVLLIKSDLEEYAGLYSLLGDLVRPDEDLESASYRILKQRTGLENVYLEQVQTFGEVDRHPSGRVITVAYYSLIDIQHHDLQVNENELGWHSVKSIERLAFDHKQILDTCLQRLRNRIVNEPIVFHLLPEKFTLRELQKVYEAILDAPLDRRNFRKKIAMKDWLTDLRELETDKPHRPGRLYALKQEYKSPPVIHSPQRASGNQSRR
ncbi:MAG: NUDIX domain-containing protein [Chitinophagaceae bacterium]|nr:NUDIX domain-containing protein [Chitinophagaceae bacterium]